MKKIIITADDFGIDTEANEAIFECSKFGILTDTCIMANCKGFEDAVEKSKEMNINIGVHLNIIEGKSLINNKESILTDKNGNYKLSYIKILLLSFNKSFLNSVEKEFEAQIEKAIQAGIKPTCLNSHVHTHSIPNIFNTVCRLAKKYEIKNIRTQGEIPYLAGKPKLINIIKNILLNTFTLINKNTTRKYNLHTNDNFIGVMYTGEMNKQTVLCGLKKIKNDAEVEIILHPTKNKAKESNYKEYLTLIDEGLKESI